MPLSVTPKPSAEPLYGCGLHETAVKEVQAVLAQASAVETCPRPRGSMTAPPMNKNRVPLTDAVGVKDDSPKLRPLIVTMPPAERARLTASLELTTGAAIEAHTRVELDATRTRILRLDTVEAERHPPHARCPGVLMGPSRGALVQLVCLGDLPSKLNGVVHVLAVPRAIIEVRCTPPEYDCGAHSTAVTDVHAVLEHWSDVVSDAVGELRHARRHQL